MPSIFKVDPSDVETFTVVTNPIRTYVSSSTQGSTGSVFLFAHRSSTQKDVQPDSSFVESAHDDADLSSLLQAAQMVGKDIRNTTGFTSATGSFTARFASGSLFSVGFPQVNDPFLRPVTASVVFPIASGSFLVSGSTVLTGTTGNYLTSGSFQFNNADLAADFTAVLSQYMSGCTAQGQAERLKVVFDPIRFSPPPVFNSNTLRKLAIKDMLQTYYRTSYPTAHWAYTNYNTLNFFTASSVPTDTALLYPNIDGGNGDLIFHQGYCSGTYTPSGSFSFDFHINPRYQPSQRDGHFKAGTILHLSSTYALSLISGSAKDQNGRTVGFRLQLQLSHSADVSPSTVLPNSMPGPRAASTDLIFVSDDNSLQWNNWHHVVVRWGTDQINHGTGSFNIDLIDRGTFVIPSSTITPLAYGGIQDGPTVLAMGNFFEGPNHGDYEQANFFAGDPALRDGLNVLTPETGIDEPIGYRFNHPLNAELHDVAIRRCYVSDYDIAASASVGPTFLDKTFALYVPPFFVEQSPYRQFVNDHGGILVTPFEEVDGATTAPFSVALSFGVVGHYINLENFVKDFASEQFPLLHHLTGVAIQNTTDAETCNEFLYAQPFVVKRNLSILPCDDGQFVPSFQLLASETLTRAVDDLGLEELSFINIDNLVMTSTLLFGAGTSDDGTQPDAQVNQFANIQIGATPESPFTAAGPALVNYSNTVSSGSDVEAGAPLTVFQRTQDPSSNEIVIFDISNLFYGFRMQPKSLFLQDSDILASSLLGSNIPLTNVNSHGPVQVTLADDGMGNVYRADCLTPQSTWNSVGNVYYDEGLICLKSPHLYFFGQNQYALNLRGEQHVHVMKIDVFAPNNTLNSSSNPNFVSVPVNGYPNDVENDFVYITGINFHDTDLNVVAKTSLAQPIAKRPGDKILFKIKYDF
jgi:hypothetical protein